MHLALLIFLSISVVVPYTISVPGVDRNLMLFVGNVCVYACLLTAMYAQMINRSADKIRIVGGVGFIVLLVYSLSSVFFSQGVSWLAPPVEEQLRLVRFWLIDPLVVYLCVFLIVRSKEQVLKVQSCLVIVLSIMNLVSIVTVPLGIKLFRTIETGMYDDRFSGILGNSNQNAYLFCILTPVTYYLMKKTDSKALKVFYLISLIGYLLGIVLTGSRGGVLTLILVFLGLMVVFKDYKVIFSALSLSAITGMVLVVAGNQFILHAIDRLMTKGDVRTVTAGRSEIWQALYNEFSNGGLAQLVGWGVGTSQTLIAAHGINASAHNWYIRIIMEYGLIGSFVWLFIIFLMVRSILGKRFFVYGQVVLIAFLSILVASFFSDLGLLLQMNALIFGIFFCNLFYLEKGDECL